ncbi:barrier-to-autointegration factor-like [Musca autumnalis]|uniref:barrier-to-autointegration factor-like n=1 Tax=Musca autumnalis TaxID=221902 RepID=UPI003CF38F0C
MAGTSMKHREFLGEPIGNKPVTELPGIGRVLGDRLIQAGFDKAYTVLGMYLVLQKDEHRFTQWLKSTCNASRKQASDCYNCLQQWTECFGV